jgi:hypothetical protein
MLTGIFCVGILQQFGCLPCTLTTICRDLDHEFQVEVSGRVRFGIDDSFSFEAQSLPTLTAGRNLDFDLSPRSRNGDTGSLNSLSDSDRDLKGEIKPVATEDGVGLDANNEV